MDAKKSSRNGRDGMVGCSDDVPGIVIADGGVGHRAVHLRPRVRAFVYGEKLPSAPTLPFGRWKVAS
jgi:hypothetical protein